MMVNPMNPKRRLFIATMAALGVAPFAPPAFAKKHEHHDGKGKLGEKIKKDGDHMLEKKGPHTVHVHVKAGKIAGVKVKHDKKGDVAVKKYKTNKKMAAGTGIHLAAYDTMLAQAYSLGTTYIGYAYIDDYGDEQIYWWPYEMIYDGDTGAIEYVPQA